MLGKVNIMLKKAKYRIAVWGGKNGEEGQKVIEILTLLGAKNKDNLDGLGENKLYIIGKGSKIVDVDSPIPEMPYVRNKLYTAGEFFLNFPFRVDDWVQCKDGNLTGQITSLSWNEDEGCVIYQVSFGGGVDYGFYKAVVLAPTIVREVVNIASVLKECPRGMELDSAICTDLYFDFVDDLGKIHCFIQRKNHRTGISFYPNGTLNNDPQDKCVIFPRNRTSWEGFQRPFKDGDVVISNKGDIHLLRTADSSYCAYRERWKGLPKFDPTITTSVEVVRSATKEEQEKLFDAIEANGYRWDSKFKVLEKVRIDPGDVVVSSAGNTVLVSNIDDDGIVHFLCRLNPFHTVFEVKEDIGVGKVDTCKLASDKQKQRLFDCLASRGYRYNPETNTLEKLADTSVSKLHTGDVVKHKQSGVYCTVEEYAEGLKGHYTSIGLLIPDNKVDEWEIMPDKFNADKFDITTLKPFDKVLVRTDNFSPVWRIGFYDSYNPDVYGYFTPFCVAGGEPYQQCIPYKGNEHLRGKTDDCSDYFKTWE